MSRSSGLLTCSVVTVALAVGLPAFGLGAAAAALPPSAATNAASQIDFSSATLNGTVDPFGTATSYYFQYGTTPPHGTITSYGTVTLAQTAGAGFGAVGVSTAITGLTANSTYYFQIVAVNVNGTSFGAQQSFVATTTATVTANRVAGADRYQTSATIAEMKYPGGVPNGNVVLATGADFPDALAGSYLAGQLGAPIVLTPPSATDPAFATTTGALSSLKASHVYILGGTSAIGDSVQTALSPTYAVTRIGGTTRYDTMRMIDTAAGLTVGNGASGSPTAILANGGNFPDALAAGPLAWAAKLPVILTDGTQATLAPQATGVISTQAVTHFIVMGGPAAINPAQLTQLGTMGTVDEHLAGVDRTDTAAQLAAYAQSAYNFSKSSVILAAGQNFPDALSAGAWGGDTQNIYLTATADTLGSYTAGALQSLVGAVTTINTVGGLNAVDANAATAAQNALQGISGTMAPVADTTAATSVTTTSATLNATVNPNGASTTYYFEYGTTPSYGLTTPVATADAATGSLAVSAAVTGLASNTTYYFQLVASNAYGTSFGGQSSLFSALTGLPTTTSIAPLGGAAAGGTSVTISGTNLTGATAVDFGATAGTIVVVNAGGTQLTATSPAESAGTVSITVTTPAGTSSATSGVQYTYLPAPPP
jgi:putative cell wall-binding protein